MKDLGAKMGAVDSFMRNYTHNRFVSGLQGDSFNKHEVPRQNGGGLLLLFSVSDF